jgi:hypothetical protein
VEESIRKLREQTEALRRRLLAPEELRKSWEVEGR